MIPILQHMETLLKILYKIGLRRVPGVARTNAYGSSETELRITINPEKMAYYGLTVPKIINIMRQLIVLFQLAMLKKGKREYIVRAEGEIQSEKQVEEIVLISEQD